MENIRHEEILKILKKRGKATVKELSDELFVCEMTIRRDLRELDRCGLLTRYRGGAAIRIKDVDYPIKIRRRFRESEKKELALAASEYLCDNSCVFLDSSSVCMYLIPHIAKRKNIRLVTNSVQTVLLAAQLHIPCELVGGSYFEKDMCLVGGAAVRRLCEINPDTAFISSSALSDDGTVSDIDEQQTEVRRAVIKNARKTVFVFDSTKLHKTDTFTLYRTGGSEVIITPQDCTLPQNLSRPTEKP